MKNVDIFIMRNEITLFCIFSSFTIITYLFIGFKYKSYQRFQPYLRKTFDLLHVFIVLANILLFLFFSYLEYSYRQWSFMDSISILIIAFAISIIFLSIWSLGEVTFFQQKGIHLIQKGSYKYVRHPIYSGGIVAAIGLCILTSSLLVILYTIIIVIMLMIIAALEESELRLRFGKEYTDYARRTAKFIPLMSILVSLRKVLKICFKE